MPGWCVRNGGTIHPLQSLPHFPFLARTVSFAQVVRSLIFPTLGPPSGLLPIPERRLLYSSPIRCFRVVRTTALPSICFDDTASNSPLSNANSQPSVVTMHMITDDETSIFSRLEGLPPPVIMIAQYALAEDLENLNAPSETSVTSVATHGDEASHAPSRLETLQSIFVTLIGKCMGSYDVDNLNAIRRAILNEQNEPAPSCLERLPNPLVDMIAQYLEAKDINNFRRTSTKMHGLLEFRLRKTFKEIRCFLVPSVYKHLKVLQQKPYARAVETLNWVNPLRYVAPVKLDIVEYNNALLSNALPSLSGLRSIVINSVNGFPNLRAVSFANARDLEGREYLSSTWSDDDMFWKKLIFKINKQIEVRFYGASGGYWGVLWPGSTRHLLDGFFRTSTPFDVLIADGENLSSHRKDLLDLFTVIQASFFHMLPTPQGSGLRSLHLHRTVTRDCFWYFLFHSSTLEEVTFSECILKGTIKLGRYVAKSIRTLRILSCKMDKPISPLLELFFTLLRDQGRLENLQFEGVIDVTFDWDNDGSKEDGSRVPSIIKEFGMKTALTKMSNCVRDPEYPSRDDF
ncbi:hypothetical protein HDK64DRAFT_256588 [Phyllosticta capitalensis]